MVISSDHGALHARPPRALALLCPASLALEGSLLVTGGPMVAAQSFLLRPMFHVSGQH